MNLKPDIFEDEAEVKKRKKKKKKGICKSLERSGEKIVERDPIDEDLFNVPDN